MASLSVFRRTALAAVGAGALLGVSACSAGGSAALSVETPGAADPAAPGSVTVGPTFTTATFADPVTGQSLSYNLHLPADYDPARAYPMVVYLGDADTVGKSVTAPLTGYGAHVWASDAEQSRRASIVVVPQYPGVILDDHGTLATTDYVEMTGRLVTWLENSYAVDQGRVYGTGEGMGATAIAYLSAEHPDLFTASLLVAGRPDLASPVGLADATFVSVATSDDDVAIAAQAAVHRLLVRRQVACGLATWDAPWSAGRLDAEARRMLAEGNRANLVRLDGTPAGSAYRITALREWLFRQSAS